MAREERWPVDRTHKLEGNVLKFIASLVIASAIAVPVAFAQPRHNDHHGGPGHHRPAPHHMAPLHRHDRYMPGHHYHSAPHGWHRYHRRPHDWRTRGCIIVGPVWFCP